MDRVKDGDGGSEDLGGEKENYQFHPLWYERGLYISLAGWREVGQLYSITFFSRELRYCLELDRSGK